MHALLSILLAGAAGPAGAAPPGAPAARRDVLALRERGKLDLALRVERPASAPARADVVYVHGATFGAELSVFFPLDGRSWADALTSSGFAVWGFDFAGYGASGRFPPGTPRPAGALDEATDDLRRVVAAVRGRNGGRPVVLLAHSRGGAVAARYAGDFPQDVAALVLFAPVVARPAPAGRETRAANAPRTPSHYPLSVWAQYRRFVEDVPRGSPQVLAEAHMQAWGEAFLASDPTSRTRTPPSVLTPYGPIADLLALWSGEALYDPARIAAPTLVVRGEWDSVCADADAARLVAALGSRSKRDVKIARATHLMHLEEQRTALYAEVNRFLEDNAR